MLLALMLGCRAPPSVILVSLDTLRADRLGVYGNPDGLTPNLDRFGGEGVVFTRAYSQATTTAPSHASVFTSRYPSEQEQEDRRPNITDMPTLAEVLGVYGWESAAFVAGGDLSPEMGLDRGFGSWTSARDFGSLWHTVPAALAWLDARRSKAPWFLFLHGYDAHTPYIAPAPFGYATADMSYPGVAEHALRSAATERILDGWLHPDFGALSAVFEDELRPRSAHARERLRAEALSAQRAAATPVTNDDVTHIRAVYDAGVAYADVQFGLLMAELSERGVLDTTTIVVMSDHGEQLGEDGIFNHCCGVGEEETHVVLMVRPPGGAPTPRRVDALVELVDVMPTIVELAGGTPPAGARGMSLMPALRGEPFAGHTIAWTQGGPAQLLTAGHTPSGRLVYSGDAAYEPLTRELVRTAALPGPSFTAVGLDLEAQRQVRSEMVTWMASLSPPAIAHAGPPLSAALRAELRAHGYFEVEP